MVTEGKKPVCLEDAARISHAKRLLAKHVANHLIEVFNQGNQEFCCIGKGTGRTSNITLDCFVNMLSPSNHGGITIAVEEGAESRRILDKAVARDHERRKSQRITNGIHMVFETTTQQTASLYCPHTLRYITEPTMTLKGMLELRPPKYTVVSAYGLSKDGTVMLRPEKTEGVSTSKKDLIIEATQKIVYLIMHPRKIGRGDGVPMKRAGYFQDDTDKVYRVVTSTPLAEEFETPEDFEAERKRFYSALTALFGGNEKDIGVIRKAESTVNGPVIVEFDIKPTRQDIHQYSYTRLHKVSQITER